jgi:hypothetical protein
LRLELFLSIYRRIVARQVSRATPPQPNRGTATFPRNAAATEACEAHVCATPPQPKHAARQLFRATPPQPNHGTATVPRNAAATESWHGNFPV